MQLFVCVVLVGVVYADASREASVGETTKTVPDWANEERFGKFQNAWAGINDTTAFYYMYAATYETETTFGGNFSCLNVHTTSVREHEKTVDAVMSYKDSTGQWKQTEITTKAISKYSYSTENALEYGPKGSTGKKDVGVVVFSDSKNCDIMSVKNGEHLELWVNQDVKDAVPDCCLFTFAYFSVKTTTTTTHKFYEQGNCKKNDGK
uniref:Lipocalin n=1 Tax=Rhipicephalus appendiculatus TaxID=34631 RepID=A0A131YHI3_RHIAP